MYLRPLVKPRDDQWFSVQPIGKSTLKQTIGRMCRSAGFQGFYSNHSLRATCATRLFHSGVDEQLIAKTTGHRSNAVRKYKRSSTEQEAAVSDVIQGKRLKAEPKADAGSVTSVGGTTTATDHVHISLNVVVNK
ncbi:uncharacterized protein LOC124287626 [Haliotis rubra]|uniref:uncharacterized protein LOC124287626 n=1 Tax=Haliotis rubra TaxID=36100 RepID=UPI001EE52933|nr:uncharacterized protein LOC124287626 [Haliotis rubra]